MLEANMIALEKMLTIPYQELVILTAYRTDKFAGWLVGDIGLLGSSNIKNVRLLRGGFGGILKTEIATLPASHNILATVDNYSFQHLDLVYDAFSGLYRLDPLKYAPPDIDELVPHFAERIEPEIVYDPSLGKEIWKITIELIKNATWHDGKPFTADDVIFSYQIINITKGLVWGPVVETLINVTKVDDYKLVVYGDIPSYIKFWDLIGVLLIPKHIWGDPATYGKATWDDVTREDMVAFDPAAEGKMVGLGMYKWKSYVEGELYVLEIYSNNPYSVRNWPEVFAPALIKPEAPAGIAPKPIVVMGGTFEADSYSPVLTSSLEISTKYESVYAKVFTIALGFSVIGLLLGIVMGLMMLRRK